MYIYAAASPSFGSSYPSISSGWLSSEQHNEQPNISAKNWPAAKTAAIAP